MASIRISLSSLRAPVHALQRSRECRSFPRSAKVMECLQVDAGSLWVNCVEHKVDGSTCFAQICARLDDTLVMRREPPDAVRAQPEPPRVGDVDQTSRTRADYLCKEYRTVDEQKKLRRDVMQAHRAALAKIRRAVSVSAQVERRPSRQRLEGRRFARQLREDIRCLATPTSDRWNVGGCPAT